MLLEAFFFEKSGTYNSSCSSHTKVAQNCYTGPQFTSPLSNKGQIHRFPGFGTFDHKMAILTMFLSILLNEFFPIDS